MAKKAQNETVYERHEDMEAKRYTANLKVQWEQAQKDFQALWEQVLVVARRYVEVEQGIRTTESKDERRNLIRERAELQVELEVLPLEVGPAKREQELARFRYFKAEEQRLQKWGNALVAAEQQYYNPQTQDYEYPAAYDAEWEDKEQALQDWERAAKEAGVFFMLGPYTDWHNESLWEAYAYKRQDELIQQAIRNRDSVLNGTYGKNPVQDGPILFRG